MRKMILTRGPSCSGKTTWAERFIKENPDYVNINRDDIRFDTYGRYTDVDEKRITEIQTAHVNHYLSHGQNVIISDTNLNPDTVTHWRNLAAYYNYEVEIKDFLGVSLNELYERNQGRIRQVKKDVIRNQYTRHREMTFGYYLPDYGLPFAYMFDVDGTLALNTGGRSPYDHTRVKEDVLNLSVGLAARALSRSFNIIIMTGRVQDSVKDTAEWLDMNRIVYAEIHARPDGNVEKDSIVKYDLFMNNVAKRYCVLGVFDDRNQVVNMWRQIGLTCFQVADGNF